MESRREGLSAWILCSGCPSRSSWAVAQLAALAVVYLAATSGWAQQSTQHAHDKPVRLSRRPEWSSSSVWNEIEDLADASIRTRAGSVNASASVAQSQALAQPDFERLIERVERLAELSPEPTGSARPLVAPADPNNKTSMRFVRHGKTFASIVFTNKQAGRRLINCHLVDLERHSDDVQLFESKYGLRALEVEFADIMRTIDACTNIARLLKPPKPAGPGANSSVALVAPAGQVLVLSRARQLPAPLQFVLGEVTLAPQTRDRPGFREALQEITSYDSSDLMAVWRGILPGTNWCGMGDRATSYNDLGFEADIDICCRAHDFCPVRLAAFTSGYGLFNWSFYTRSHCTCDQNFLDCLQRADSPVASVVMRLYFNVMKTTCLQGNETATPLHALGVRRAPQHHERLRPALRPAPRLEARRPTGNHRARLLDSIRANLPIPALGQSRQIGSSSAPARRSR